MTKFDWLATDSAPENYPMKIVQGDFIYPEGGSLYIPTKASIENGWGTGVSSHVVGPDLKPLPHRIDITFFSYTENAFYRGSFALPYENIVELFNAGYYSSKEKGHTTYKQIIAGVAPGGTVAVWLEGINRITEVFFGKADKADIPWSKITDNTDISREAYIKMVLEDSVDPDVLKVIKRDGIPFDLWSSYRTRYYWQPEVIADHPPPFMDAIFYFNGEEDNFRYPLDEATAAATRAVPKEVFYIWDSPEGKRKRLRFFFDEAEIFAAFKKLAPNDTTPLKLEFHTRIVDGQRMFATQLSNPDESIVLRKMTMKR